MQEHYRNVIRQEFENCLKNTLVRLKKEDTHRPFHSSLLSPEALFWSRLERSFSTSFGQRVIEQVSKIAALAGGAERAETQHDTTMLLSNEQNASIEQHIRGIRENSLGQVRGWTHDLQSVMNRNSSSPNTETRVRSDLWWFKDGVNNYMSIKTVKPNIDQTAEAKRDLLKLKIHDPSCNVYFGLYYNPFGESRENYNWAPPARVFNFQKDEVVLIGKDYWDTLGGPGCYEEILELAKESGENTKGLLENLWQG